MEATRKRPEDFLELVERAKRGRLKVYIGAAAGVASFEELKIDQLGVRYTLDASTNVTKDGTSGPFDVTP